MIEVNHLTKRFGAVAALQDISFQVETGSIFGLVGSNGAGNPPFCAQPRAFTGPTRAGWP